MEEYKVAATREDEIRAILARPYGRLLIPEDDGSWFGRIIEFPGCFASGDTIAECAVSLEEVAHDWLLAVFHQKQSVPQPAEGG